MQLKSWFIASLVVLSKVALAADPPAAAVADPAAAVAVTTPAAAATAVVDDTATATATDIPNTNTNTIINTNTDADIGTNIDTDTDVDPATNTIATPATATPVTPTTATPVTPTTATPVTPTTATPVTPTTATPVTPTTATPVTPTTATPVTPTTATPVTPTTATTPTTALAADTDTDTDIDATTADDDSTDTASSSSSSSSAKSSSAKSSQSAEPINPNLVSDSIVGTWSSKSNTVFTGPEFYDPVDELLIEPALPGISYSFTDDGFWEEAIYQVSPNPKNHSCPTAILIYQHGTYVKNSNGSLTLTPFEIDGRQLLSQPCNDSGISMYSRYKQHEAFKAYQVYVDPYHGKWRLDLIKSTGAYMQPLYLAYQPPQMLPTITMNPTTTDGVRSSNKEKMLEKREYGLDLGLSARIRRSLENSYKTNAIMKDSINYSLWWWTSASMMVIGAIIFIVS